MSLLYELLVGHFLCDYPLQGDFIGRLKNRHVNDGKIVPWWQLMAAHSFIHGGMVLLITQSIELALIETVLHYIIDVLKCEGLTDINFDQSLHIICKLVYCGIIWSGVL